MNNNIYAVAGNGNGSERIGEISSRLGNRERGYLLQEYGEDNMPRFPKCELKSLLYAKQTTLIRGYRIEYHDGTVEDVYEGAVYRSHIVVFGLLAH